MRSHYNKLSLTLIINLMLSLFVGANMPNFAFAPNKETELSSDFKVNLGKLERDTLPHQQRFIYPPISYQDHKTTCESEITIYEAEQGKKIKTLPKELLFTYSPPNVKPYLKSNDLIKTYAHLSVLTGGYKFLTLEIEIVGNAQSNAYGEIKKGAMISIQLVNGKSISLFNTKDVPGTFNAQKGVYEYEAIFPIDRKQEKILRDKRIDLIRLIWESGYETYPVYNVSFFIQQFNCLDQIKN